MPDMLLVCWRGVKDGLFLFSLYQGKFYVRLKFTGKPLLVKSRNRPLYQERFYVRSKFRRKSISQLCVGIGSVIYYCSKKTLITEKEDQCIPNIECISTSARVHLKI